VQACGFFLDHGGFATESRQGRTLPYAWNSPLPVTNGSISLPTRCVIAIVPFVIRRRLSRGPGWTGLSGGVAFPKLSKLLNQENALSAPFLRHFRNYCGALTALTSGCYFNISTVCGARREGKKISLVTTAGRCFFIIAQRSKSMAWRKFVTSQTVCVHFNQGRRVRFDCLKRQSVILPGLATHPRIYPCRPGVRDIRTYQPWVCSDAYNR
jgi:hypothetical protein